MEGPDWLMGKCRFPRDCHADLTLLAWFTRCTHDCFSFVWSICTIHCLVPPLPLWPYPPPCLPLIHPPSLALHLLLQTAAPKSSLHPPLGARKVARPWMCIWSRRLSSLPKSPQRGLLRRLRSQIPALLAKRMTSTLLALPTSASPSSPCSLAHGIKPRRAILLVLSRCTLPTPCSLLIISNPNNRMGLILFSLSDHRPLLIRHRKSMSTSASLPS